MADSHLTSTHSSFVPPDPRAGRRRFGPTLLMLFGLGSIGVVYAYRDRLRPATASATVVASAPAIATSPTFVEATSLFAPLLAATAPPSATASTPAPRGALLQAIDAFAAPTPSVVPPTDPARFRLQSIVYARRGGSCLINGKAYRIGDRVDGAIVRAIDRDRVFLRLGLDEIEVRLPDEGTALIRVTPSR